MGKPAHPHLPAAPLFDLFDDLDDGIIAAALGISRRTVYRWRNGGIPWPTADRVSAHIGVHPMLIWPAEWQDLLDWGDESPDGLCEAS